MDKNLHCGYTLEDVLAVKNMTIENEVKRFVPQKTKVKTIARKSKPIMIRRVK